MGICGRGREDGRLMEGRAYRHPSKEGMRIMADYVEQVLERCVTG